MKPVWAFPVFRGARQAFRNGQLLDTASCIDRLGVTFMTSGALVNGGSTWSIGVLGNVWCHAMPAHELHEPFAVVAFIGTNGFRVLAGQCGNHLLCRFPFAVAVKGQASAEFSLSLVQHHQWKQRQSRTRGHQGFFPGPIRSCRRVGMESLRMEEEPFVVSPHARAQVSVLLERGWTTAGFWCKRTEVFPWEEVSPSRTAPGLAIPTLADTGSLAGIQ